MDINRVTTADQAPILRELSIEYMTTLLTKVKEHHGLDYDLTELPQHVDDWLANTFPKFLPPEGYFFLASVNGQVAGMGGLQKVDADTAEIKRMYVKPAFRGLKIGKAILNRSLDVARADGYTAVILDTFKFWEVAPKFYHAMGFVETEPNPNAEPPPELVEHCIFMRLDLE